MGEISVCYGGEMTRKNTSITGDSLLEAFALASLSSGINISIAMGHGLLIVRVRKLIFHCPRWNSEVQRQVQRQWQWRILEGTKVCTVCGWQGTASIQWEKQQMLILKQAIRVICLSCSSHHYLHHHRRRAFRR